MNEQQPIRDTVVAVVRRGDGSVEKVPEKSTEQAREEAIIQMLRRALELTP